MSGTHEVAKRTHRTQFDRQLLAASVGPERAISRNHGRQILTLEDGTTYTALTWGGAEPALRLWRGHELIANHRLAGQPSAPCLLVEKKGDVSVWLSVDDRVFVSREGSSPVVVEGVAGRLQDVVCDREGRTILAVSRGGGLHLTDLRNETCVDPDAGAASLALDDTGALHLAYEQFRGVEYRAYRELSAGPIARERPGGAFAQAPVILAHDGNIFIVYLGEHGTVPDEDRAKFWADKPWNRRIGIGGFIAALVKIAGETTWRRFALADSKQFAKPLWPKTEKWGYNYPGVDVRVRMEEFSAPAIAIGPDGVPQVFWADTSRRWVYASRFLGEGFSPAAEVRGPIEQLTGPPLLPRGMTSTRLAAARRAAWSNGSTKENPRPFGPPLNESARELPIAIPTRDRVYLDAIRFPDARVSRGRHIDFLQPDELAISRGFELSVNEMRRFDGNPVLRAGARGSHDDSGVVCRVEPDPKTGGWQATCVSKWEAVGWRREIPSSSRDGIDWPRMPHYPPDESFFIDGEAHPRLQTDITFVRDEDERDPDRRFKGLWLNGKQGWGTYIPLTSPDGNRWTRVPDTTAYPVSDGIQIWIDRDDIPRRRFKAIGSSRSFCGRVCVQFTSADGMHWDDVRDSLDWHDPFGSDPYFAQTYASGQGTGRILVDPWAGPDDEDEIHGGYIFRDGDRWLLHYMKWTGDGHIFCSLATSRDGISFTRVARGVPTLPLGLPGTWDSGRLSIQNSPALVGDVWRQYYVGCGWKHGFEGVGLKPHPTSGRCAIYSPNQVGFAEIPRGHWGHLWLTRDRDAGELITIPLVVESRQTVSVDVEGMTSIGTSLQLAVLDSETLAPLPGYEFDSCSEVNQDGLRVPVSWRGKPLPTGTLRLAARVTGHRVRLYGIDLKTS